MLKHASRRGSGRPGCYKIQIKGPGLAPRKGQDNRELPPFLAIKRSMFGGYAESCFPERVWEARLLQDPDERAGFGPTERSRQ